MINVEDFCNKLEGFYDNWNQASSNPAMYAHCKLRWERIGENELTSKQWYHYMGEKIHTETNGIVSKKKMVL